MSADEIREAVFEQPSTFESSNYRGIEYLRDIDFSLYMKSCGIQKCLPGYSYPRQAREGYHLHVVLSGKGILQVRGCELRIHEGQLFVLKDGETVYYEADKDDPWHYVWVTYGGEKAERVIETAGFTDGIYVLDSNIDTTEFFTVVRNILERPHMNVSSEVHRLGLALHFISLAIESHEKSAEQKHRTGDFSADDYVNYAVEYIDNNYAHIRIGDVAKYIGVNRTYFSDIFKKKMYISPQEYLMQVRMNKSRELLLNLDVPIYVIAQSVGYEDQLSFSKMFRKRFGMSPENYRKKNRP